MMPYLILKYSAMMSISDFPEKSWDLVVEVGAPARLLWRSLRRALGRELQSVLRSGLSGCVTSSRTPLRYLLEYILIYLREYPWDMYWNIPWDICWNTPSDILKQKTLIHQVYVCKNTLSNSRTQNLKLSGLPPNWKNGLLVGSTSVLCQTLPLHQHDCQHTGFLSLSINYLQDSSSMTLSSTTWFSTYRSLFS